LSPCEDGTLLAAVVHHEIDAGKGTVSVGSWTKIPGAAPHVQKLPMPEWALLASLKAKLTKPVPAGVSGARHPSER
jgi:hypothetical protein